jgi:hypothetical protein
LSPPSLYERALGDDYTRLPAAVQRLHRLHGHTVMQGWVETHAPRSLLAQALALCLGAPRRTTRGVMRFELTACPAEETWTRHFPARTMTSSMRWVDGRIEERLGAARLRFDLHAAEDRLSMKLVTMRFLGVPCPRWLLPRVVAQETGAGDCIHFLVTAELPFVGRVIGYRGYLEVGSKEAA